jgi:hypothetical protein
VSTHGPAARILIGLGLLGGLVIALASIVVLHGSSLVAVAVAAGLVGCVAYGIRDDGRAASRAAAWKAASWTMAISMLVAGVLVLAGGSAAALVSGLIGVGVAARWVRRVDRAESAGRNGGDRMPAGAEVAAVPLHPTRGLDTSPAPVSLLPTSVLGREWSRTTEALAFRLDPAARHALVCRRHEVLDELERRDVAGFARWLDAGATTDRDPTPFVRGNGATGTDAA